MVISLVHQVLLEIFHLTVKTLQVVLPILGMIMVHALQQALRTTIGNDMNNNNKVFF